MTAKEMFEAKKYKYFEKKFNGTEITDIYYIKKIGDKSRRKITFNMRNKCFAVYYYTLKDNYFTAGYINADDLVLINAQLKEFGWL